MERYETRLLDFLEQDADDQAGTAPPAASTSSTLGIVGARGVGKSTLLRLAYQYYCYQRFFRYVFHADAREADGGSFTADALRGVLASGVGFWPYGEGHVIASFLRDQSFVLMLDGVRAGAGVGFDLLVAAGLPATLGPRQKVVFATRDESVCADMGCTDDAGNVIRMGRLGHDDAWNLFHYRVGGDVIDSSPMIKKLAKEIVRKCRGHPGALVTVGGTMSITKLWESWSVANELLSQRSPPPGAIHGESDDDQGYPCLQSFKEVFGC